MAVGALTPRDQLDRVIALVKRSFRYAWVAALIGVIGTALAIAFALNRTRLYESKTVILHQEIIPSKIIAGSEGAFGSRNMAYRFGDMVLASTLLQKIIIQYNLYPEIRMQHGMNAAFEEARLRIGFAGRGSGNTFTISFKGTTPEQAQAVTARIADLLIEWEEEIELKKVTATKTFLDKERVRALDELKERERKLAEFLSTNPEFAVSSADVVSGAAGAAVRAQSSSPTKASTPLPKDRRLRALVRQKERIKARLTTQSERSPAPGTSPERRAARTRKTEAERELGSATRRLEESRMRFTDSHPDVVATQRRVKLAQQRLAAALVQVEKLRTVSPAVSPLSDTERTGLDVELRSIKRDITARRKALRGADSGTPTVADKADVVVALETEWAELYRQVQETRKRYDALERKSFTAEIAAASEIARQGSQLTIVDPAFLPSRPAGVGRTILVIAGMLVFGGIGAAVALGLALVDDRIIGKHDIEKLALVPVLGVIPKAKTFKRKPVQSPEV